MRGVLFFFGLLFFVGGSLVLVFIFRLEIDASNGLMFISTSSVWIGACLLLASLRFWYYVKAELVGYVYYIGPYRTTMGRRKFLKGLLRNMEKNSVTQVDLENITVFGKILNRKGKRVDEEDFLEIMPFHRR